MGKKLLLAILPTALLLVGAELAVRWSGAAGRCPGYKGSILWVCDPVLYFKANPGQVIHGIPLNREGFRSRDFAPKTNGAFQIAALGDSCTFGVIAPGSPQALQYVAEPYPQRLERMAAERASRPPLEVLNGAVPGYNSYQAVMLLRTKLRRLRPDLVTVRLGWNDHAIFPDGGADAAFREPGTALGLWAEEQLLRTAIYPFSRRLGMELRARFRPAARAAPGAVPRTWRPAVPPDYYKRHLERIVEIARRRRAAVWLLTAPHAYLTDEHRGRPDHYGPESSGRTQLAHNAVPSFDRLAQIQESYNAAVREAGARLGVPVIDMEALYRNHAGEHLFESGDFLHPNQAGHDLEAEALWQELLRAGLLRAGES